LPLHSNSWQDFYYSTWVLNFWASLTDKTAVAFLRTDLLFYIAQLCIVQTIVLIHDYF
jgi:hypothetical protein